MFIASHSMSVTSFLLPHLRELEKEYDVHIFANTLDSDLLKRHGVDLPVQFAPVERAVNLLADLKALKYLYKLIKQNQYVSVHTITPKAGLLGMLAAIFSGVPLRIHVFTGQVWVTRKGLLGLVLRLLDKLIANLATDVIVDSLSQRDFLIKNNIVKKNNSVVLGNGSICGVDTARFYPDILERKKVRDDLNISQNSILFLYLGRLNRDKGVLDLIKAFSSLVKRYSEINLLLVGPDEEEIFSIIQLEFPSVLDKIIRIDYTTKPEGYMKAADLFCLPSYREGFGLSVIEAAACGVPALVSRIYGLTDAVDDGKTGWMHMPGDVQDLLERFIEIMENRQEIEIRGEAARRRVCELFDQKKITDLLMRFYQEKLVRN